MDSFTRNYTIVLVAILLGLLAWWGSSVWQPRVWELNDLLEADAELADYPYQFRLVRLDGGVATLSTPRSFQFPAVRFLQLIHPELAGQSQDDPGMMAAQQDLIDHQKRAQGLMLAQPDVQRVDWELDVKWLSDHGVHAPSAGSSAMR
ncbi:hypothetical protein F2Q65_15870 [Thiohalocapsa marina]|uniref:Glutamate-ammonia-ligase adenylyltransferase n=1 Tax=Thiohalocapsa marina TaxID=424902 RepID=A0A5M8FLU1_9GAMM|nr:hypothetical protein [Thiohalocapsa marina]KAA6183425.1 hypothetical protein F2Q65_15870 [Thiohalocapsa marina]